MKRRTTGYAEKLKERLENCKKKWHFALKADITSRQGCCRYFKNYGCMKGICNISGQKLSDMVWHPNPFCTSGVSQSGVENVRR